MAFQLNRHVGVNNMHGVVLAGGKSTRMPHKLWLCDKNGVNIAVQAGRVLRTCKRVDDIVYCVNEHDVKFISMIKKFLDVSFIVDNNEGLSVLNRIHGEKLILCADNVYGLSTLEYIAYGLKGSESTACVNTYYHAGYELDSWDSKNKQWVHRAVGHAMNDPLVTPWHFMKDVVVNNNIIETLNRECIQPQFVRDNDWADLGTPESVERYYANIQS